LDLAADLRGLLARDVPLAFGFEARYSSTELNLGELISLATPRVNATIAFAFRIRLRKAEDVDEVESKDAVAGVVDRDSLMSHNGPTFNGRHRADGLSIFPERSTRCRSIAAFSYSAAAPPSKTVYVSM
jgi:hypothetical protein